MDWNKYEASRAKEIAEKKFIENDIVGAKKLALKAQNLYPGLEGILHLLATLDVFIAAKQEVLGEADWYRILDVNPKAGDETVRRQYRKLALMLHPDKNKSIGGDGAFKLVSQAWSLLSDKSKRETYNHKRNAALHDNIVHPRNGVSSAPPNINGFCQFSKTSTGTSMKAPKNRLNSFWTVCHWCKMHKEYLRVYLNHNLHCPNCHKAFFAVEMLPPSACATRHSNNSSNFLWGPFSRTTGGASAAAKAAVVVQQAYEEVKRKREAAQEASKKKEALRRKNPASRRARSVSSANLRKTGGMNDSWAAANQGTAGSVSSCVSGSRQPYCEAVISNGMQNILMMKAQVAIKKKLREWNSTSGAGSVLKEGYNGRHKETQKEKLKENDFPTVSDAEEIESMSIDAPDSDFHYFDKNRTEQSFVEDPVWAVHDDDED